MASASASADFYTTFQSLKQGQFNSIAPRPTQAQDLRDVNPVGSITATQVGVEKLTKSDVLSALEPGQGVSEPSKRLTKLKVELGRALPSLPAYDQRSYDLQVKELETRFAELRGKERLKQRFAFKSRSTPSSAPDAPNAAGPALDSPPSALSDALGAMSQEDGTSRASIIPPAASSSSTAPHVRTYTISSLSGKAIRPPDLVSPTDSEGRPVISEGPCGYTLSLDNLQGCLIDLRPSYPRARSMATNSGVDIIAGPKLTTLHAKSLKGCILLAPLIQGSAMLSDVVDSLIIVGGQQGQFRMHSSTNTIALLHVASVPVIEHCTAIRFGGYPTALLEEDPGYLSRHDQAQDFDWIRGGTSPNWCMADAPNEDGIAGLKSIASRELQEQDVAGLIRSTLDLFGVVSVGLQQQSLVS